MKKAFSILMFVFALTAMVSCEKDNDADTSNTDPIGPQTDILPAGFYWYTNEEPFDEHIAQITNYGEVHPFYYTIRHEEFDVPEKTYQGFYQYSNATQKGTVDLKRTDDGSQEFAGKAEFSYKDGSLTVKFLNETVTLTMKI